ncbi:MAG: EamA family transporter [Lachnospiraceae bacterium]|nr:EamA family transporter [Lachnospiraceae bacterium]
MNRKSIGFIIAIVSAVIYGLVPLLTRTIYESGSNSLTVAFLRFVVCTLVFYIAHRLTSEGSIGISKEELPKLLVVGASFGFVPVLLYTSYNYLATGLATTLHFVYPVFVVLGSILFKIEKPTKNKLICCVLCMAGIVAFYTPGGDISIPGILIALASGILYAFYTVYLTSSGLLDMDPYKLSFWKCLFAMILIFIVTAAMGKVSLPGTAKGWIFMLLLGIATAAASFLYQEAARRAGAQNTAMLSTFEPLTSVIVGYFAFGEQITARSAVGIVCILLSVILLGWEGKRSDHAE